MRVLKTMAIVVLLGGLLSVPTGATAQTCSDVSSIQGFADFIVYKLQSGQRGQLLACLERSLMGSEQNFSNTLSYKGMPLSGHVLEITRGEGWTDPALFKDFLDLLGELEARLSQQDQKFVGLRGRLLNMQSKSGFTVLHYSAARRLPDHVKFLLDSGEVNPRIQASGGDQLTAAELAGRILETFRDDPEARKVRQVFDEYSTGQDSPASQ